MTVKIAPEGGLLCERQIGDTAVEATLLWGAMDLTIRPKNRALIPGLVGLLTQTLGDGIAVGFDQSLLSAAPGCPPSLRGSIADPRNAACLETSAPSPERDAFLALRDREVVGRVLAMAGFRDKALAGEATTVEDMQRYLTERRVELEALRQAAPPRGLALGAPVPDPKPPEQIGGVSVGGGPQPDPKPTGKKPAGKKKAAPGDGQVIAGQGPGTAPPTEPAYEGPHPESAFARDMGSIDQRQQAERSPAEANYRTEPPVGPPTPGQPLTYPPGHAPATAGPQGVGPSPLDADVRLLTEPPMRPEVGVVAVHSVTPGQYEDSPYLRLFFGQPLSTFYAQNPGRQPTNPPNPRIKLGSGEEIAAAVELLRAIHDRALVLGRPIEPLVSFFGIHPTNATAVHHVADLVARRQQGR